MRKASAERVLVPRVDKFKFYDLVIYAARSSSSARRLATVLGARRWRDDLPERYSRRRPYFRGNNSPMVVNWGSTTHPQWLEDRRFQLTPRFINHATSIQKAIDKLAFFQHASRIDGVPLLKWTDKRDKALAWLTKGKHVICRTKLGGSSGEGIVAARTVQELVEAPLYTRYYPKTHEFRVHVFNGQVIDLTQKKLKGGANVRSESNTLVRSLDNGWAHTHSDCVLVGDARGRVESACISVLGGLGLEFGAVDVLAVLDPVSDGGSRNLKSFVICEVNTGPGLENQVTIEAYTKAILALKNGVVPVESEKKNGNTLEGISGD